jgi:hypothetical protein
MGSGREGKNLMKDEKLKTVPRYKSAKENIFLPRFELC